MFCSFDEDQKLDIEEAGKITTTNAANVNITMPFPFASHVIQPILIENEGTYVAARYVYI